MGLLFMLANSLTFAFQITANLLFMLLSFAFDQHGLQAS